ncbi:hypothetical protein ACFXHA_33735 [Nocardia sp. NPDC059240]|uniref:hypothetical protein n=1 Tax=Nocardia sp. NPDC059240 TaxID=3346786 RepID=UPI00368D05A7
MGETIAGVSWLGFLVGTVVFGRGMWHGRKTQQLLGIGIAFYALTMRLFARLGVSGVRQPMDTEERVWAATFAVAAGTAMLALLLVILKEQQDSLRTHRRRLAALCAAAVASTVALRTITWLPGPEWPPSNDFLNAYGGDLRVVGYELIFAAWLGLPLGALGMFVFRFQRGFTRWATVVGCVLGVGWAGWKVAGTAVRYCTGDAIPLESPVSVATALTALTLLIGGLLSGQIGGALRRARETREYTLARRADDERHATPAPDSTNSPAA